MSHQERPRSNIARRILRVHDGRREPADDRLAVEEPLEIRLCYAGPRGRETANLSITMRTPGHDHELAAGFLLSEGLVASGTDIEAIELLGPPSPGPAPHNMVRVDLAAQVEFDLRRLERHFYTTSSCGVCGKTSLDALAAIPHHAIRGEGLRITAEALLALPAKLRDRQAVFGATGGLHATALFDASGQLLAVREDVGRHNAMDKLIGAELLGGRLPLGERGLLVSGRASFELAQKALMAGCPLLAAVGAPSSLAVDLAERFGITLLGFLRDGRFNIYAGASRVA